MCDELDLSFLDVDGNVTVKACQNDDGYVVFIFNYTAEPQKASITLNVDGNEYKFDTIVDANGFKLLKKEK